MQDILAGKTEGTVRFHIKVTAIAYFNNRTDRIAGYFYY